MLNMYTSGDLVPDGIEIIKRNDPFFIAFNVRLDDDAVTRKLLHEVEKVVIGVL